MRIGLVTKWFASGQAVVSRQIRSALDELDHQTFVLAKPGKGPRAQLERVADPVWEQPAVTYASEADIPLAEYRAWVRTGHTELATRRARGARAAALVAARGNADQHFRRLWDRQTALEDQLARAQRAYARSQDWGWPMALAAGLVNGLFGLAVVIREVLLH